MEKTDKAVLMQGNEAIARGAVDAGINFFAGYPITPSTEITEFMSRELTKRGGVFLQMEDEIASIAAIIGASLAGAKSMTATSGPGISLMAEGIGYAKMIEQPCVVVNVMRGGPSTGLPTQPSQADIQQSRWASHGDAPAIVLYPASVLECYELTIRAVNLAEKYRTCVILLSDAMLGHMREPITMPDLNNVQIIDRIKPTIPPEWYKHYPDNPKYRAPLASFGDGYRFHVTGLAHDALGFPTTRPDEIKIMAERLNNKILQNHKDLVQVEIFGDEDARVAIFAAGITARAAKAAIKTAQQHGKKMLLVRPLTIWPFPDEAVTKYLSDKRMIIIPELSQGQLSHEVKRVLGVSKKTRRIVELQKVTGELISPEEILNSSREAH
ncbi:MAG: 2-oxoacid:acceptor oxidoreductase subunit alpha [Candidatus Cloacimonetes bacterium]|nr:2-oxoacid:acceptor oxidoreductase subunit alpha [Candidatus Cloacimonadota bacterium]